MYTHHPVFAPAAARRPFLRFIVEPDDDGAGAGADGGTDGNDTGSAAGTDTNGAPQDTGAASTDNDGDNPDGSDALGDPGKKALDEMKRKWKAAETARKTAEAEAAALRAKDEGREAEHQQALAAQQIKDDALAAASRRILKAELRAAAAGKLTDPTDALTFIDLDAIDVDDDGNVDRAALDAAITNLVTTKPYLAAQSGGRFQGGADGGARNAASSSPHQYTAAEVERMTPQQIVAARRAGQLADYLSS